MNEAKPRERVLSVVIKGRQATVVYDRRDGTSWRRTEITSSAQVEGSAEYERQARYFERNGKVVKSTTSARS